MKKTICFAYFGDGVFLGWYADTFGSIRPISPKLYRESESQIEVITDNFRLKIAKIKEGVQQNARLPFIGQSASSDADNLSKYKEVELRIVECPHYDGPNPNFDREKYDAEHQARRTKIKEQGIYDLPAGSKERLEALEAFDAINPKIVNDHWIYADYDKVKVWAATAPTEFLAIIKAE